MSGIVGKNLGRGSGIVTATPVGADAVSGANIADDAIDSEHYAVGSIDEAHIADNAVTLAKMAGGTDGQIITYDASGNPSAVGPGTDGQVLTSTGSGSPPAFEAVPASGFSSAAGAGHTGISGNQTIATTALTKCTFTHELYDDDSNFDLTNERYVAPADGRYLVCASVGLQTNFGADQRGIMKLYKNGAAAFSPLNDITGECNTSTTSAINTTVNVVVPLEEDDYLEVFFIHFTTQDEVMGGDKTWLQVYRLS